MTQKSPPPLPTVSCPNREMDTDFLDGTFDSMLANPQIVSPDDFDDNLSATKAEDTLAVECIVSASSLVWCVPTMCPTQLKACYRLLHPHHPNYLIVVHWSGGGKTHILRTLGVIERGITIIFIPLLTLSANVMHKFERTATTWGNVGVNHLNNLFDSNRSAFTRLLR